MSMRLIATLLTLTYCGAVGAMDLMDLYREALANDAQYAAARAQYRAMQERVPLARAGVSPQVNLDSDYKLDQARVNNGLSSVDSRRGNYNAGDNYRTRPGSSIGHRPE